MSTPAPRDFKALVDMCGNQPTDWDILLLHAEAIGLDTKDTLLLSRRARSYDTMMAEGEETFAIAPVVRVRNAELLGGAVE